MAIEYAKKYYYKLCISWICSFLYTEAIAEKENKFNFKNTHGKTRLAEDVSNCVAFLSSDLASYVTGETIHVNGGMYVLTKKEKLNNELI